MTSADPGTTPALASSSTPDGPGPTGRFDPDAPYPGRSRAGRRSMNDKFWAGLSGWKHAIRGDSSFFAHAYRALLVACSETGQASWAVLKENANKTYSFSRNIRAVPDPKTSRENASKDSRPPATSATAGADSPELPPDIRMAYDGLSMEFEIA